MKAGQEDFRLLDRLPVGKWFAAGAVSVHSAKLGRLFRLGLLRRRPCPAGLAVSRRWDYLKESHAEVGTGGPSRN